MSVKLTSTIETFFWTFSSFFSPENNVTNLEEKVTKWEKINTNDSS